jgi:SAM-dependent methyltransferase
MPDPEPEAGTAAAHRALWGAAAEDWAAVQEGMVRPLYEAGLHALGVGPGTRLLDAGCGAGMAAVMAAERGAEVTGLDATPQLLAIARRRLPAGTFVEGALERLPFDDGAFDAVTGFNSFQFAGDPVRALEGARRVTRPGGAVLIAVWGRPEDCEATEVVATMRELTPPQAAGARGPSALSDEGGLERVAAAAGLTPEAAADVECVWEYPDPATALRGLLSAGPARLAITTAGEEAAREAVSRALDRFRTPAGGYRLRNVFRYLVARVAP